MIGSGIQTAGLDRWYIGVSILVVLDDWFGPICESIQVPSKLVSILVVLDDWFGPHGNSFV